MGKIGGVQTLLNCSNLSSFPSKLQRSREPLFFFCLVLLIVCFLGGSNTQNEEGEKSSRRLGQRHLFDLVRCCFLQNKS
ncbi:hypothetical protein DVH24_042253 [Malus domestica]|uniref:Uncharacterized protein n=1 Tax=Malus domestica TaxID=3750 RepID=A0A498J2H0_MALDO|nr:hypothetical protein DVH24_042253 [Malus domestica]